MIWRWALRAPGMRASAVTSGLFCTWAGAAASLLGCAPELALPSGAITEPTIVAVVAEPAEVAPGEAATYRAYLMTPAGLAATAADLAWAYCTAPKPPLEDNAVPRSCLYIDSEGVRSGDARAAMGEGLAVAATVPVDACRLFGPDVPPGGLRPRDPDATGGFYQPVLVAPASSLPAAYAHRIRCGLPTAPPAIDRAFRASYVANANPVVHALDVRALGPRAWAIELVLAGASAETFVLFDPVARVLTTEIETLDVQFWTTAGQLTAVHVAPAFAGDGASGTWRAQVRLELPAGMDPSELPESIAVSAVVRDSRGGSQVASAVLPTM